VSSETHVEIAVLASSATLGGIAIIGRQAETDTLVLAGPFDPCGECDVCRRGGAAVCPARITREVGDRVTAAARFVVPIEHGLELAAPAGAAVAGDIAYTLYARTGPGPRDPVVIAGASPVARFLVEILRAKGIAPIVVASAGPWADWVRGKGAIVAADATAVNAAIAEQNNSQRAPRVIAATADAIGLAAELTGPRSTLTVLGPVESLPGLVVAREVTVISVAGPHPDLVVEVAAMCTKGDVDLVGGTSTEPTADHRAVVRAR
jgi:D-arabinose 1-dehydrogenase-like Zn-dependent alcohol dehydrogenase